MAAILLSRCDDLNKSHFNHNCDDDTCDQFGCHSGVTLMNARVILSDVTRFSTFTNSNIFTGNSELVLKLF